MSVWAICLSLVVIACVLIGDGNSINRLGRPLSMKAAPGTYLAIIGRQSVNILDPAKAKALAVGKKKKKDAPRRRTASGENISCVKSQAMC